MPKRILCKKGIFEYLNNMYKRYENTTNQKLYFNFKNTRYIDRKMLGVLGLIFTKLKSKNNEVIIQQSQYVRQLLIKNNFFEKYPPKGNIPSNLIAYKSFSGDDNDGYRYYLNQEMENLNNPDIVSHLTTHIMEIFLNVKTHARKNTLKSRYDNKEVFSSGYFDKKRNFLEISISNNGRNFNQNIYSKASIEYTFQYEYILWALKAYHSTTKNRPGGAGLSMLVELLKNVGGSLTICSGKAFYSVSYSNKEITSFCTDLDQPFPGTSICMSIPISALNSIPKVNNKEIFTISQLLNK